MRTIPKTEIAWIVARFHVATKDELIAKDIRHRLRRNPWIYTPAGQRFEDRCVAYALKCHRQNRDLCLQVNAGYLN